MVNDPKTWLRYWSAKNGSNLFELWLTDEGLYFEAGPDEWPARAHEGTGGRWTIEELRADPDRLDGFRYLYDQIEADLQELGL